jgi:cytochrome c-type biogenesis protein CcmE
MFLIRSRNRARTLALLLAVVSLTVSVGVYAAFGQNRSAYFYPGNLVVSRSVYDNNAANVRVGMPPPPFATRPTAAPPR